MSVPLETLLEQLANPRVRVQADCNEAIQTVRENIASKRQNRAFEAMLTPTQYNFIAKCATKNEMCLFAGNQTGKTHVAGLMTAWHALGVYPDKVRVVLETRLLSQPAFEPGPGQFVLRALEASDGGQREVRRLVEWRELRTRRYLAPPKIWISSATGEKLKETLQYVLFGRLAEGAEDDIPPFIPRVKVQSFTRANGGTPNLLERVLVKRANGGLAEIALKFASKGTQGYTGAPVDFLWLDEIHPGDVYMECVARTSATGGALVATYSPTDGKSAVSNHFTEPRQASKNKSFVSMALYDATFYSRDRMDELAAKYPPHEREARIWGRLAKGEGLVFPYPREQVVVQPFQVPSGWLWGAGMDFGLGGDTGHPCAFVLMCQDPQSKTFYVVEAWKSWETNYLVHAARMVRSCRPEGTDGPTIYVHWPHDGEVRMVGRSDEKKVDDWRKAGVPVWHCSARYVDEKGNKQNNTTWIGELAAEIEMDRFKVFAGCKDWLDEKDTWHWLNGALVTTDDDVLKATKSAFIMRRHWQTLDVGEVEAYNYLTAAQ